MGSTGTIKSHILYSMCPGQYTTQTAKSLDDSVWNHAKAGRWSWPKVLVNIGLNMAQNIWPNVIIRLAFETS